VLRSGVPFLAFVSEVLALSLRLPDGFMYAKRAMSCRATSLE
jgi:hypothetical protein